jgi:hypothetical protein
MDYLLISTITLIGAAFVCNFIGFWDCITNFHIGFHILIWLMGLENLN